MTHYLATSNCDGMIQVSHHPEERAARTALLEIIKQTFRGYAPPERATLDAINTFLGDNNITGSVFSFTIGEARIAEPLPLPALSQICQIRPATPRRNSTIYHLGKVETDSCVLTAYIDVAYNDVAVDRSDSVEVVLFT